MPSRTPSEWTKFYESHTRPGGDPFAEELTSFAEAVRDETTKELKEVGFGIYAERNRLVALLAALYPSSLQRHDEKDVAWENDWRWVVFIDLPCGQATWHIHDSQIALFDHVQRTDCRTWDGHTTESKYARINEWVQKRDKDDSHDDELLECGHPDDDLRDFAEDVRKEALNEAYECVRASMTGKPPIDLTNTDADSWNYALGVAAGRLLELRDAKPCD